MRANLSTRDYEQISAYLDGQLSPGEKRKLEERMQARPELKTALEELNQTRMLLRSAPRRKVPRNFTLTPAMVGDTGPARKRSWFNLNLFPALGFASAVATLLLVATIVFELGSGGGAPMQTAMQPQLETAAPEVGILEAPQADTQLQKVPGAENAAPGPVIVWGDPYSTGVQGASPGYPGGLGGGAADGMGGAGGEIYAERNLGGGAPDGSIVLPPQAVESLPTSDTRATEPTAMPEPSMGITGAEEPAAEQESAEFSGSGPILGAPVEDTGGEIIGKSAQGRPIAGVFEEPLVDGAPGTTGPGDLQANPAGEPGLLDRSVLGLTLLRWAQILLILIALATGAAAVILRRRSRT